MLAAALLASGPIALPAAWTGTDEEFVHMVESNNWEYFLRNQAGPYGMFRGSGEHDELYSYDPLATCAGDGFGIAALVVGAYRGWTSDEYAYTNILRLLRAYDGVLARDGNNFFNHFYDLATGAPQAEYSPIDSTWFLCGAILAAQYFKGSEIEELANHIYDSFRYGSVGPFWNMYFEYTIINIVGSGSPTNGWSAATAQASWESCTRASPSYMQGPLFWYQWPQAFVDFRHRVDSLGSNHFHIAMHAMLRQRQKCAELHNADPLNYPTFGSNAWGLTSGMASLGYLELRPFAGFCTANPNYGVPSIYCTFPPATNDVNTDEEACDSGTLTPICLPACMAHTPYEARLAMKHLYNTYDNPSNNVYDRYSFKNALNTGRAKSGQPFQWDINAAMDYGCNVVVLENFRSGMPWKYFMSHPYVAAGMQKCGFTTPYLPYHDDWNDASDPNAWGGGTTATNTDGSNPVVSYDPIAWHNTWVNGHARKLVANGSGDVVRIGLNETDQSKKDLLSFWLRGQSGGETFDVGLRDAEGHQVLFDIAAWAPGGTVGTNWVRVRVPLKAFAVSGNPNCDVRILFLGDFVVRFRAAGTLWIEDLAFVDDDWAPPPPALGAACLDGRVTLRWGYSDHDDVVGYHLWRRPGTTSGFERINARLMAADHEEDDPAVDADWGEDYFYAVQCVDRRGNAGLFSSGPYERRVLVGRAHDVDFGDGLLPNAFGGTHGAWGSGAAHGFVLTNGWDGRWTWVRGLEGGAWGGGWIGLNAACVGAYDALRFHLRQSTGAEDAQIGLKSTNNVEIKLPISRYAAVTGSWTEAVVPLVDFLGVDFSALDNLSITFPSAGSLLVEGIRFERLEPESDARLLLEGERVGGHVGGSTNDFKPLASGGRVLGSGWGASAGDDAWWVICPTHDWNEAYLDVRYACGAPTGRVLVAFINSEVRGALVIEPTGGWGDAGTQFREATARLGRITNACFLLKLAATNAGSPVNLDRVILRSGSGYFREAEDWDTQWGSTGEDRKAGASGGRVLGSFWGTGDGHFACYSNVVLAAPLSNAVLRVRYGQNTSAGRLVTVFLDGTNMGRLACARTGGWLGAYAHGGLCELPLGNIAAGGHELRFETHGPGDGVNLDWFRLTRGTTLKAYDRDRDGIPDSQEALFGTAASLADTDGDGLTDLEEVSRLGGGYLTDPAAPDSDGDGVLDGEEVLAGTDPTDAASVFRITSASTLGGAHIVCWPSRADRLYAVRGTTNLREGFSVLASPIAPTPPVNVYTDTAHAAEAAVFYDVFVTLP